jgi:CRP-like cAMP-binding protein
MAQFEPAEIALVRSSPLLAGLSDHAFRALMDVASVRRVSHGEQIFVQGEPATYFFIVLDGWVKVLRLTPAGMEAVVAVFTRGQSFAEAAAFTEGRFPATAEAVTDGRLVRFQSGNLRRLIRENPDIGLSMLASTSMHLHMLVQQIEQLKSHTGAQRVAEFLLSLCGDVQGPSRIDLPYDKTLIAGRLGMQPESLSRAFAKLRSHGVTIEQHVATISSPEQLRNFVSTDTLTGA